MGGQAQESLDQSWLTPESLVEFIEELRNIGFNVGVAQYIATQDLLLMLAARGERLDRPQRVAALLRPLLCSSPAEQDTFPEHFARWAERRRSVLSGQAITHEQTMVEALDETAKRGLRLEWILFICIVIALLFFSLLINNFNENTIEPTPAQNETTITPAVGDETANRDETTTSLEIAGVAILMLGGASLIWRAAWQRNATHFLQRRQSNIMPDIKQISVSASDDALFPSLTFLSIARLFRQRVPVDSQDMNIVKTVEQTVEHGGWLIPAYGNLLIPPEYLILVDRRSRFDHLAQFMETMIRRLKEHGVFISMYTFDADPRLCFPSRGEKVPQSLAELARRYENMRLILFTEAEGLLSPTSGRLAPWTRLFNRWTHRAVLTPEPPMKWGSSENEIRHEFTVLPGTGDGLASFMQIILGEKRIDESSLWGDSGLPAVLREHPQRMIARDAPSVEQVDSLLDELRKYLGDDGYTWLCACAVYPELHWPITIRLGQLLRGTNNNSLLEPHRLADLSRLPWFRYGTMPDWLRIHLILDLSPDQEAEVRAVLEALLVTAVQGYGEASDLEIAYERREWTSRLARSLLRLLRRKTLQDSPIQDHVFLDFMFRRLNLAVRVPEALRRQLFTRTGNRIWWRSLFKRRSAVLPLPSSGPTSFFQVWINALTRPNEQTFAVITASPNAKKTTAFLWVFISSFLNFFVLLVSLLGFVELNEPGTVSSGLMWVWGIVIIPFIGFFSVLSFAIVVAIVQWIARLLGGKGTFTQLAYAFGAIYAPFRLVSTAFIFLSVIPYVGLCFYILGLVAVFYVFVLQVMAIKGVNKFGWGKAIGSMLIPVALVLLFVCLIAGVPLLLGPRIGNVFSTINSSLSY